MSPIYPSDTNFILARWSSAKKNLDSDLKILNCETMKRSKRVFSPAFKAEAPLSHAC